MPDPPLQARSPAALAALALSALVLSALATSASLLPADAPAAKGKWYALAYRRAVIDMHIPDWDEKFLSEVDPDQYVDMLVRSRAQSIVLYAQSHVGLFNYPTKVGAQHKGLKGRDLVRELIDRCHSKGIACVLYTSLIHDRWAFDEHPEWRMKHPDGREYGAGSRYGVVCPNSPYRDYVRAWVEEICGRYDFEGIRFDMTFWVGVCYCEHCKRRWAAEAGGDDMPTTVDWLDERWVKLQRKREEWLADFAAVATGAVRRLKPSATVEHQASTFPLNWTFGVAQPLVEQNDFLQGDFYGDQLQGSFVRKLLSELSPSKPFGFETSFSVELRDHTGSKPEPLLEAKASAAIADGAAFIFIDAIDPIGSLSPLVHDRMGRVFDRLMPYYEQLGGERVEDVAIYYSLESKLSFRGNGRPAADPDRHDAHTESSMQAARWLISSHIPFGVITRRSLAKLPRYKALVLSGVNMLDPEEAAAIREWVRAGGGLYASGSTSLVDARGRRHGDFQLADVLGVSVERADWRDREHYIAPAPAGAAHFADFTAKRPAFAKGYAMDVVAREGTAVLATRTLPWPAPEPTKFSSIHSNPPWVPTEAPEVTLHPFGKGKAVYSASLLETVEGLRETFVSLVRLLAGPCRVEADAPGVVEVTAFRQPDRRRLVVCLVNFQRDLPNVPVDGIRLLVRLEGERVARVRRLPGGDEVPHAEREGAVEIVAPRLETLVLLALELAAP
ncbi:MAG: beta-galactosidase [Planctomycetes bacterium]|nr:beta-galactosidase [Planctomycetota bacterium]